VFGWGIPCYRIARYVINSFGVEFFGTSGTVEVGWSAASFCLVGWHSSLDLRYEKTMCYWCEGFSKSVTENETWAGDGMALPT